MESKQLEKKKAQSAQRKQREKRQKEEKKQQELEAEEKRRFASLTDREKVGFTDLCLILVSFNIYEMLIGLFLIY